MGKKTKNQQMYDQMLRSMLAPKSYMQGLIAGANDDLAPEYSIPAGMTEEQAMLAVMGAILEDGNITQMETRSSGSSVPKNDWKKIWLFRDYPGKDENRGILVQEAIRRGRAKAAEAFRAYENGDHTAVNEMLSRAGSFSRELYDREAVQPSVLWYNAEAVMRLCDDASGDPETDALLGYTPEEKEKYHRKDTVSALTEKRVEAERQFRELPEDAPVEARRELLADIWTCGKLLDEYNKRDKMTPNNEVGRLVPPTGHEDDEDFDYLLVERFPGYKRDFAAATQEYRRTHPDPFMDMITDEDGRDKLFADYREAMIGSGAFNDALNSPNPNFFGGDAVRLEVPIEDRVPEEERNRLLAEWEQAKETITERFAADNDAAYGYEDTLTEKLDRVAAQNGLADYTVCGKDALLRQNRDRLGTQLWNKEELYLLSKDGGTLVRVRSADGEQFTSEIANEMRVAPGTGSVGRAAFYVNELYGLKRDKTQESASASLKKVVRKGEDPLQHRLADLCEDYRKLDEDLNRAVEDYSEQRATALLEQARSLRDRFGELKKEDFSKVVFHERLPQTGYDMLDQIVNVLETSNKKIEDYNAEMVKDVPGREIPLNERTPILEERIRVAEQKAATGIDPRALKSPRAAGSRDTNARADLGKVIEMIRTSVGQDEELAKKAAPALEALEKLNLTTASLYRRDENGKHIPMTKENYGTLLNEYDRALGALNGLAPQIPAGNAGLATLAREAKGFLSDDVSTLTGIDPTLEMSLPDAFDQARTGQVNITGKELSYVGAKSNRRYAMDIGEGDKSLRGFFTKEEKFAVTKEELSERVAQAKQDFPYLAPLLDFSVDYMYTHKTAVLQDAMKEALDHSKRTGELDRILAEEGKTEEGFRQIASVVCDERVDLDNLNNKYAQYGKEAMAAEEGSSITNRNVAMTKVANLFGLSDIIAHSRVIETVDGDKTVKGVFMANAKGISYDDILPDVVKNTDELSGENPTLIKQISELQTLDYICQNIDRHQSNLFYQFSEDGKKVIGIQGIDNDLSFGTNRMRPGEQLRAVSEVRLENMQVMPKELADRLLSMDNSTFFATLSGLGLGEKEREAACERLNNVREELRAGRIRAVEDSEWKDLKLSQLAEKPNTLFSMVHSNVSRLKDKAQANQRDQERKRRMKEEEDREAGIDPAEKKPFGFEKADVLDGVNEASRKKDRVDVTNYAARIRASQKAIWGKGSPQFRKLRDAVDAFGKQLDETPADPSDEQYRALQAKLEVISECADAYLGIKTNKKVGSKTRDRMELAKEIGDYAKKRLETFKEALHRKDEIAVEEANAAMKAQADKTRADLMGGLENAGKIRDKMNEFAAREGEGPEARKMMAKGVQAMDKVIGVLNGTERFETLTSDDDRSLDAVLACHTLLQARTLNGGEPGLFERALEAQGVDTTIEQLHAGDRMKDLRGTLTLKSLLDMTRKNDFSALTGAVPGRHEEKNVDVAALRNEQEVVQEDPNVKKDGPARVSHT